MRVSIVGALMIFWAIIAAAAKQAGVPVALMLAICSHESHLTNVKVPHDHGSPSYGVCQLKYGTAQMVGFKGKPDDLMKPEINAKYASMYLRWQLDRYDGNWCRATSAYNSGTYSESKKYPGIPRNMKYIKLVRRYLYENQSRLQCEAHRK
jgi:soluble lytic murein transglycosylase-like protein